MQTVVSRRASDYELTVEGEHAGRVVFVEEDGVLVFTHTKIEEAFGGQGMGGLLAKGALDDVRTRGLKVVPECSFIKAWIDKHPDYADLVA